MLKYKASSSHANTQKISLDPCGESVLISFSAHEDAAMRFHCCTVVVGKAIMDLSPVQEGRMHLRGFKQQLLFIRQLPKPLHHMTQCYYGF